MPHSSDLIDYSFVQIPQFKEKTRLSWNCPLVDTISSVVFSDSIKSAVPSSESLAVLIRTWQVSEVFNVNLRLEVSKQIC